MDTDDNRMDIDSDHTGFNPGQLARKITRHLRQSDQALCERNYPRALIEVSRAYEHILQPCPAYHFRRIRIFKSANEFTKALHECDKIQELECTRRERSRAYQAKANIFRRIGRHGLALRLYRKALEFDPDFIPLHLNIASLLSIEDDFESARPHLLKIIAYHLIELRFRARRDPSHWTHVGHLYRRISRRNQAALAYRTAIRLGIRGDARKKRQAMEALRWLREMKKYYGEDY